MALKAVARPVRRDAFEPAHFLEIPRAGPGAAGTPGGPGVAGDEGSAGLGAAKVEISAESFSGTLTIDNSGMPGGRGGSGGPGGIGGAGAQGSPSSSGLFNCNAGPGRGGDGGAGGPAARRERVVREVMPG
jgi:hypothetical protein